MEGRVARGGNDGRARGGGRGCPGGGHRRHHGDDRIRGTNARDQLTGHVVLWGRGSADNLDGDGGRDTIYTGPKGESVKDVVDSGPGNDRVYAFNRPASRDIVNCGSGFDRVTADSRDVLEGCNRVSRP